jgi:hypothetical protein
VAASNRKVARIGGLVMGVGCGLGVAIVAAAPPDDARAFKS